MTQTSLSTFEHPDSDDENDDNANKDIDTNNNDDERRIDAIITADVDDFNEIAANTIEALPVDSDNEKLYEIPKYEFKKGEFADLPSGPDEPIGLTGPSGDYVRIHVFPEVFSLNDRIPNAIADIIDDAANGDITHVVTYNLHDLGRDTDEIAAHVDKLLEAGTEIQTKHVDLAPENADFVGDLIRAVGDGGYSVIPVPDADELANDDATGGRPPLGFEYIDGELTKSSDHYKICCELAKCSKGEQSQRATARELDCAPRTVKRCIEKHPDRYRL